MSKKSRRLEALARNALGIAQRAEAEAQLTKYLQMKAARRERMRDAEQRKLQKMEQRRLQSRPPASPRTGEALAKAVENRTATVDELVRYTDAAMLVITAQLPTLRKLTADTVQMRAEVRDLQAQFRKLAETDPQAAEVLRKYTQ